jgi:hypothetical protein
MAKMTRSQKTQLLSSAFAQLDDVDNSQPMTDHLSQVLRGVAILGGILLGVFATPYIAGAVLLIDWSGLPSFDLFRDGIPLVAGSITIGIAWGVGSVIRSDILRKKVTSR